MRGSRSPHSSSSESSRSYFSGATRHRSCSSRHSSGSTKKPTRKMKLIIAIGIALPIIAAIIGVVAWAVSADHGFQSLPITGSLRRSDLSLDSHHLRNHEEDIFQALEDRQDIGFGRHFSEPSQDLQKHDFSQVEAEGNQNQFDDTTNKDPLYIVHFVPSPNPKIESSTTEPSSGSTVSSEVLKKILSASKGAKPGTPQFVVFAPVPETEDPKNEVGTVDIGTQAMNVFQNQRIPHKEIDYDYEEELRKYQELLDSTNQSPHKETSRVGQSKDKTRSDAEAVQEALKLLTQNFTAQNMYKSHQKQTQASSINQKVLQPSNYNQQNVIPQLNYQQNQGYSQTFPRGVPQGYSQVPQNYDQQIQQHYPQASNTAVQVYPKQGHATDRSGYSEPIGIKLNIGNGRGLLGGGYSPLGIIGSILRRILPRPQVNLNGKVMFGVMLEKGVKFGDRGHGQSYG